MTASWNLLDGARLVWAYFLGWGVFAHQPSCDLLSLCLFQCVILQWTALLTCLSAVVYRWIPCCHCKVLLTLMLPSRKWLWKGKSELHSTTWLYYMCIFFFWILKVLQEMAILLSLCLFSLVFICCQGIHARVETDGGACTHTYTQTDKQMDRQTDRQTHTHTRTCAHTHTHLLTQQTF